MATILLGDALSLGSVHKLREGEGMGDLRGGGDIKIFYDEKGGGGPEMLLER